MGNLRRCQSRGAPGIPFCEIDRLVVEWNASAHPFNWKPRSFNKILTKVDADIAASAALKIAA
jgi:hypothetical protein